MNESEPRLTTMNEKPATTSSATSARSVASIVLAVTSIGLCLLVEVATLASRPWLSRAIDDFGMNVSAVTRFAVGPLFPMFLAIVILVAICKEFVPIRQSACDKSNFVLLVIGVACLAIYLVGVVVPLFSLINALS
jgi:hypothetical protein